MQISDEEIVVQYFNGDKTAFTEIVNRYLKLIYNFIYRLIGNEKNAEDITQEIFLRVWKNLEKFDTKKSFRTWIFSIAKNSSIDYLRKIKEMNISLFDTDEGNAITDNLIDEELTPDEISSMAENKKRVEEMLNELTITQKQVMLLKYMNELSLSEVAEIMNLSLDTVKSHHRRALIKMRKSISAPKLSRLPYK